MIYAIYLTRGVSVNRILLYEYSVNERAFPASFRSLQGAHSLRHIKRRLHRFTLDGGTLIKKNLLHI